jgi:hypothetical protein
MIINSSVEVRNAQVQFSEADAGQRILQQAETNYARKPFLRLEQLYFSDGLIFNGVNTWVELICSPGYRIEGKDEEARVFIEKWMEKIQFKDVKLPKIAQHRCIYGNAYSEIIFNQTGNDIVDLSEPVDPKSIDFLRDARGNPILDEYGNVKGYIQYVTTGKPLTISAEKIAHFKMYTLGASQLGIGIVEPVFWTALGKRSIDEKVAQQEFRRATPFVFGKIGDKDHPPSPEEINKVHDAIKNINYKTDFVGPYWYDIQFKDASGSDTTLKSAEYFQDQIIAGAGLPKSYVLGRGETENRATMDLIVAVTQKKVERQQYEISNIMETKVFKQICELHGFKTVPKLVWNEFSQESLSAKIDRMTKEIQVGLLAPEQGLRDMIRKLEGLPVAVKTEEILKADDNATTKGPIQS